VAVAVQVVQDTIRFWRRLFVRVFHSQLRRCFSEMARRLRSSACSAPSASFAVGPRWAKRRRPRVQRRRTPSSHAMPHELQSIVSLPRCHDGAPIDGPVDCGDPSRHELDGRKVGHGAPAARRWHGIRRAGAPETAFSARSCLRLPSAPVSLGHPASRFGRAARPHRAYFRHRRLVDARAVCHRGLEPRTSRQGTRQVLFLLCHSRLSLALDRHLCRGMRMLQDASCAQLSNTSYLQEVIQTTGVTYDPRKRDLYGEAAQYMIKTSTGQKIGLTLSLTLTLTLTLIVTLTLA